MTPGALALLSLTVGFFIGAAFSIGAHNAIVGGIGACL